METILLPLIDGQTDPTIATYAKEGECSLRVTSKRPTYEEAKAACDEMIGKVNDLIGEYIYSYEDEDLLDVVGRILKEKNITISCAESCVSRWDSLSAATAGSMTSTNSVPSHEPERLFRRYMCVGRFGRKS